MRFQLRKFVFLIIIICGVRHFGRAASPAAGLERFYLGTYSGAIYQSTLNLDSGTFGAITNAAATDSPSWVALTPNRQFLYAVNEFAGMVVAFSVNPAN